MRTNIFPPATLQIISNRIDYLRARNPTYNTHTTRYILVAFDPQPRMTLGSGNFRGTVVEEYRLHSAQDIFP